MLKNGSKIKKSIKFLCYLTSIFLTIAEENVLFQNQKMLQFSIP